VCFLELFELHCCRLIQSSERIPIRVYISNESGYCLDISMYKEVMDERVGQVKLSFSVLT
jgi:hypothetical protein